MNQVSVACGFPFFQSTQNRQTKLSIGLRVTALVLAIIAAIIGLLVLCNDLGHIGTIAGWTTFSIGVSIALVSLSIKCINKPLPLPTTYYRLEKNELVLEQWKENTLDANSLPIKSKGEILQRSPVAATLDHMGLVISTITPQNIVYHDEDLLATAIVFKAAPARLMKPNVDTMLICSGIYRLLKTGLEFNCAIDLGAGSGFIAKYLALKRPNSKITAIDIESEAIEYMKSSGAGMPENIEIVQEDAIDHLKQYYHKYDLIVSNPPYVPTETETQSEQKIKIKKGNFWEGTQIICDIFEEIFPNMAPEKHIVLVVSSMSLKSQRLNKIFQDLSACEAKIVFSQEVVYKNFYAGNGKSSHLIATGEEKNRVVCFKNLNLELFVGMTLPSEPRIFREDNTKKQIRYFWQMIYVIDFKKKP
ncbi:MAG: methyltransferase [Chlamydiales bacterium]